MLPCCSSLYPGSFPVLFPPTYKPPLSSNPPRFASSLVRRQHIHAALLRLARSPRHGPRLGGLDLLAVIIAPVFAADRLRPILVAVLSFVSHRSFLVAVVVPLFDADLHPG